MDANRREQIKAIFEQALDLPTEEREAFLEEACRGDAALRRELDSLLAHAEEASGFFDDLAEGIVPKERTAPAMISDPMIGRRIGHYEVLDRLGGGGMGVVYKAMDSKLDRVVALKFLTRFLSTDEQAKQRFVQEAKAASALDHPNIGTIYEINETEDGSLYIAMAHYEGQTLKEVVARGPLPIEEAVDYSCQIAKGLAKAHTAGIIHRDIKPANLLVADDDVVKIVDFGIAKMAGVEQLTKTGSTVGTMAYMSPEQLQGGEVDHQADLWSLGVVLYEMLTGKRPFKGIHEGSLMYAIVHEEPVGVGHVRDDVPEWLAVVVQRLLSKDPNDRIQHAADVVKALSSTEPVIAVPSTPAAARRWPLVASISLLIAFAVIAGIWGLSAFDFDGISGAAAEQLSVNMIAVMPFSVQGSEELDDLDVGMVYLLSTGLEGAGSLQSVDPYTLLASFGNDLGPIRDPMRGREIAAAFNAGRFVLGSVTQLGQQLRLNASLFDADGQVQERAEATAEHTDDLSGAVEDLLIQLMGDALGGAMGEVVSVAYKTTSNREALKEYLKGEQAVREYRIEDASAAWRRAVEFDSSFALAWSRMLDWRNDVEVEEVMIYADRYRDKLPNRERRLTDIALDDSSSFEDKLKRYKDVVERYPQYARGWYLLAEYVYHNGYFYGHPASEALEYLEQAWLYDSNNQEVMDHIGDLAAKLDDFELLDEAIVRYGSDGGDRGDFQPFSWHVLSVAGQGTGEEFDALLTEVENRGGLRVMATRVAVWQGNPVRAKKLLEIYLKSDASEQNKARASLYMGSLNAAMGRFKQADSIYAAVFDQEPISLAERVLKAFCPQCPISIRQLEELRDDVANWDTTQFRLIGPFGRDRHPGTYAEIQTYLTGLVNFLLEDDEIVQETIDELRRLSESEADGKVAYAMERTLSALQLWRAGETEKALNAFEEGRLRGGWLTPLQDQTLERYLQAELLFAEARYEEALNWYASLNDAGYLYAFGLPYLGPSYFRRAQIHQNLGNTEEAISFYTRFVELWQNADPELQPIIQEAQEQMDALLQSVAAEPAE